MVLAKQLLLLRFDCEVYWRSAVGWVRGLFVSVLLFLREGSTPFVYLLSFRPICSQNLGDDDKTTSNV